MAIRRAWLAVAVAAAIVAGCGGSPADGDEGATPDEAAEAATGDADATDAPDFAGREFAVCVPGTKKGCADDQLGEVVCNGDGSGYEVVACDEGGVCLDPAKGCSGCRPGRLKCQDDDIVLRCDEAGENWAQATDCDGATTGKVCRNGVCIRLCEISEKLQTYLGCDYWAADLDNAMVPGGESGFHDAAGAQYAVVVSNTSPKYPAWVDIFRLENGVEEKVTADAKGVPFPAEPIPPLQLRVFNLPARNIDGTVQGKLAYRVVSSIPISAYQFNPLENVNVFSNDASLLLPTNVLGRYYLVMTREQSFEELKGFLTVIGTQEATTVAVTVTAPTLPGNGIPKMVPGETRWFTLGRYEVLNIETDAAGADLTGSIVQADKAVAVFGGSEAANAPNTSRCCPGGVCEYNGQWMECPTRTDCLCQWPYAQEPPIEKPCRSNYDCLSYNTCCADHLEKQLFPARTWGMEYVVAHSYPRGAEKDVYRLLAAKDGTRVTTYPDQQTGEILLNRGEWIDFDSDENFEILAKAPVMVGQFLAAQDAPPGASAAGLDRAGTGDPTFQLAVPVEQFRTDYVFLTPNKYAFDCVTIIAPVGTPVTLDGQVLKKEDLTFKRIRDIAEEMKAKGVKDPAELGTRFGDYKVIGTGKWGAWRLVIADGVHVATADKPFGMIVYGYDQYVSYGYPAGLDLKDLKLVNDVP